MYHTDVLLMSYYRLAYQQLPGQQNCYALGRVMQVSLPTPYYLLLNTALSSLRKDTIPNSQDVTKFYRLVIGRNVYFSKEYCNVVARNSYTVRFIKEGSTKIGVILYFVHASTVTFAVVNELVVNTNVSTFFNLSTDCLDRIHSSGIFPVTLGSETLVVCVSNIVDKGVFMDFNGLLYVSTCPNSLTID